MDTPELFPGESAVREMAVRTGWLPTTGNGWALVFESPEGANLTLRVYPSFFEEVVTPAFLVVETLDGDPMRAPVGLQAWVSAGDTLRVPTPEESKVILATYGVVCRVGELMPEALTVGAW
jgi:hypothetical protein